MEKKTAKKEKKLVDSEKRLKDAEKQKEEFLACWKRERADFLNYKKGEIERVSELLKYSNTALVFKFLPVLDNLYLAEKEIKKDLKEDKGVKGLFQIKKQIEDILKSQGIEEIEALGKEFNPNFQEAIEEVEADGKPGMVIGEIQKGYKFQGNVLRPAKVKISKKRSEEKSKQFHGEKTNSNQS